MTDTVEIERNRPFLNVLTFPPQAGSAAARKSGKGRRMRFRLMILALAALSACAHQPRGAGVSVAPLAETEAVASRGDAADDPAIWANQADPARSLVLGTDKQAGLYVYDLSGAVVQFLAAGRLNNVDLRGGWPGADGFDVLVAASDRTHQAVALFELSSASGEVRPAGSIPTDLGDPYGLCLYKDGEAFHIIVIGKDGQVRQFKTTAVTPAAAVWEEARRFAVGSQSEGCVVDDRMGLLYIGEEGVGIWRYGAQPEAGADRVQFAAVDGETLVADVEGLTLAPEGEVGGHLIASSQGDSVFVVYRLVDGALVGRFRLEGGDGVDNVTGTDGLDLALGPVGPDYPAGLFVAQDDENPRKGQNYKYASWADIWAALTAAPAAAAD